MADGLVTIPDVEILRVGSWTTSNGSKVPITAEHLASCVAAAQDAEIDDGPIRIGHFDPRFDGEPALGWLSNIRQVGDRLVADLKDAPAKLETVIRSGLRRRSVEINWGVKTPAGKTYQTSLAGMALLGIQVPAVKGLADIMSRYSSPEHESQSNVITLEGESTEAVEAFAELHNKVGGLEAKVAFLSGNAGGPLVHTESNDHPGDSMNDEEVRKALGLDASVPVTDVLKKIAEGQKASAEADAKAKSDAEAAKAVEAKAAEDKARADAEAAKVTQPQVVTLDRAAYEAMQADIALGKQAAQRISEQEREQELQGAMLSGKIAPASMDHWRAAYDANPEGTKTLLGGLAPTFSTTTNFSGAVTKNAEGKEVDENGFTDDDYVKSGLTDLKNWMK